MNLSPPQTDRQPPLKIQSKIIELSANQLHSAVREITNFDRKTIEETREANKSTQKLIRGVNKNAFLTIEANNNSAIEVDPGINDWKELDRQFSLQTVKQKKTAKVKMKV